MKYLMMICCASISLAYAADAPKTDKKVVPPSSTVPSASTTNAEAPRATPTRNTSISYLMIEPKARAADLKDAFEALRREKTTQKVSVNFSNQPSISNVLDFTVMSNGTIVIFRYNSSQGIKLIMANIEDIIGVSAL